MAAMGLTAADYRLACSEDHLDHFLLHVVPPIVKRPASVPFDSLSHAHEHLEETGNNDVREGICHIAETVQIYMAEEGVRDNEDEGEDVRYFDSSTLYFPTGTTAGEQTFISQFLKTPIFNNGPPVVVAFFVALGIIINLKDHFQERQAYAMSASVSATTSWETTKQKVVYGVFYMIIVMFKTGGDLSNGNSEFVDSLDQQIDQYDPFYSIFALTVLRWFQQIFSDMPLNYTECKGDDSCRDFHVRVRTMQLTFYYPFIVRKIRLQGNNSFKMYPTCLQEVVGGPV